MEYPLIMRLYDAFFMLLCMVPLLMLFGFMIYVMLFEKRDDTQEEQPRQARNIYGVERCTNMSIRTINGHSNECFHCGGWIPKNTIGGGLKCGNCDRWQPERRVTPGRAKAVTERAKNGT